MNLSEPRKGREGGLGWAGRGLASVLFSFPLTLPIRQYKVCCARETAGRAASWDSCATARSEVARNMRK